ncbi:hypothetical protein NVP1170O_059 [Vibrio phage 1.170.O._10N.261.52.C3]|nr:hypothetical protein NVP1170O_059 [Vibrio phage 1.170.O._10N.261.52.C3]
MAFGKKPTQGQGGGSGSSDVTPEQWQEWNKYVWECIDLDVEDRGNDRMRKEAFQVGVVSFILELGYQPTIGKYKTKVAEPEGDEEYSAEEREYMEKYVGSDFIWEKDYQTNKMERKQTMPRFDEEYVVCVDYPDILIDYSKHPYSQSEGEDLRPLRVDANGWFKDDFQRHISFSLNRQKELSDKNFFYKVASAAGVLDQFKADDYDLATLAGVAANFKLRADFDGNFLNLFIAGAPEKVSDIKVQGRVVAKAEDMLVNVGRVSFTGILLDDEDGYTDDMLKEVRYNWKRKLEACVSYQPSPEKFPDFWLGVDWEDTKLCKALKAFEGNRPSSGGDSGEEKPAKKEAPKKGTPSKVEVKKEEPEEPMAFDDD